MENKDRIRMTARAVHAVVIAGLLVAAADLVDAQSLDLSAYRGERWVRLVLSNDRDDDRPFIAQLALSSQWERVDRLGIEVLDVLPGTADVDAVLAEYGLGSENFGLVLVDPNGEVAFRTDDASEIEYIVDLVDEAEILRFVNRRER